MRQSFIESNFSLIVSTDESVLVTADCVVSEGETEADDGTGEESEKHGLEIIINQARIM